MCCVWVELELLGLCHGVSGKRIATEGQGVSLAYVVNRPIQSVSLLVPFGFCISMLPVITLALFSFHTKFYTLSHRTFKHMYEILNIG